MLQMKSQPRQGQRNPQANLCHPAFVRQPRVWKTCQRQHRENHNVHRWWIIYKWTIVHSYAELPYLVILDDCGVPTPDVLEVRESDQSPWRITDLVGKSSAALVDFPMLLPVYQSVTSVISLFIYFFTPCVSVLWHFCDERPLWCVTWPPEPARKGASLVISSVVCSFCAPFCWWLRPLSHEQAVVSEFMPGFFPPSKKV